MLRKADSPTGILFAVFMSMKIVETRVMRGPNQWSDTQRQLIVMKLQDVPELSVQLRQLVSKRTDVFHDSSVSKDFPLSVELTRQVLTYLLRKSSMQFDQVRLENAP